MYDLDKTYKERDFKRRESLSWRVPIICDAIIKVLKPKSVIDFGCGNGDITCGFLDRGIEACGIEGTQNAIPSSKLPPGKLYIHDLRKPWDANFRSLLYYSISPAKFDLALCLEVAEHIEPEYIPELLFKLLTSSDRILFSAARPGQGGVKHVNCQPKEYWISQFTGKGLTYGVLTAEELQKEFYSYRNKKGIKAYYQNLLYFFK